MKQKFKLYLQLFLTFIKIGVVTFGGGYAMIPIIENEISVKKKWIDGDELLEVVAISETTPGGGAAVLPDHLPDLALSQGV